MSLPNLGGRFAVGATTFRLAVPPTSFSCAQISSATSSELKQALLLDEVVFTAYYPADVQPKSSPGGLSWLIRPLSASLQGYANYTGLSWWLLWPIVYLYGALLKMPVHPDAPLLNPHTIARPNATKSSPWPLIVFSHGLGGSRTAYSQLCMRIAASGRVVVAIEHRDGSGSAFVRSSSVAIPYVKEATLVWPPDHPPEESNMLSFRGHQLDFRRSEIYHAVRAIRKLVNDGHEDAWDPLQSTGDTPVDWSRWTGTGDAKPIESEENVVLAGHSFGGATVLSILSNAPPDNEPPIRVRKALILDPWLEPIPSPGPVPHPKFIEQSIPSILVINSENFTLWKDHFERLLDVGKSWMETRWELLTIARAQHISFSDFPILPLVSSKNARLVRDKILDLSITFLDGDGCESVADSSAKKMEIRVIGQRPDGRPKRQIVAERGDVILH